MQSVGVRFAAEVGRVLCLGAAACSVFLCCHLECAERASGLARSLDTARLHTCLLLPVAPNSAHPSPG